MKEKEKIKKIKTIQFFSLVNSIVFLFILFFQINYLTILIFIASFATWFVTSIVESNLIYKIQLGIKKD